MMIKKSTFLCVLSVLCLASWAQNNVGIGIVNPDRSAILHLDASDKGFLTPRMSAQNRILISSPADGLMVYDTDSACFFYWKSNTTSWVNLCHAVTGAQGNTGAAGANGIQGNTGAQGILGNTGATGAQGIQGNTGATGAAGAQGQTGAAGTNGTNGTNGATGATGSAGTNGATGAQGQAGGAGTNGTNGTNGATGATGTQGIQGNTGATGSAGAPGANGSTGSTGADGSNGTNGTNGTNGATGATGTQGQAGAMGPAGAVGATGATGATGIIQKYHLYGSANRPTVTSTTAVLQPGLTQTFTTSAACTVVVWATIGALNTSTTTGQYANVDMIIYLDGAFLPSGGWNRFSVINPNNTNGFNTCAINTSFALAAGTHTIELRTARLSGSTSVTIGGDAALDTNPGEMDIMLLY